MELTLLQASAVGVLASVITQGLRLAFNRFGWTPNLEQTNIGLFAISLGLGVAFFGVPEVAGSDPLAVANAVVLAASSLVGAAGLSYNILLKKVLRPIE
ncbi:hypothetical protein LCGC14_2362900 [marine sediment metagenome]|uniref:Uncharacterized protein n=1 Tax=marine sediment metagenome TaxID=412755 RepID=A0A0F9F0V4_9ZZZZ